MATTESSCPICLCPLDNVGDHRVVSLSCGHLFGENCIRKWIKSAKKCPMCNVKAIPSHIRAVYTQNIVVSEAAESKKLKGLLVEAKKKVAEEIRDRRTIAVKLELARQEAASLKVQVQNYKNEVNRLRLELSKARNSSCGDGSSENAKKAFLTVPIKLEQNGDQLSRISSKPEVLEIAGNKRKRCESLKGMSEEVRNRIELKRQAALARRRRKMENKFMSSNPGKENIQLRDA